MAIDDSADKENCVVFPRQPPPMAHGCITKIVFHNFLTYDNVVCYPGPFLNVIIGPNGTGKSSVICGICLAVGGPPRVLGRSDNLGDFVKHGRDTGYVELFLNDTKKRGIRRFKVQLRRGVNSAHYFIDGKQVPKAEHCDEISSYNIQVENPCTFLAQDKVKSFAEQDAEQLLRNTEKAGPVELLKMHKELETMFENGKTIRNGLDDMRKRHETIQQKLKTLKTRVDNFLEHERRCSVINLLKKKKLVVEYERCMTRGKTTRKAMDAARTAYERARDALQPIDDRIDVLKRGGDAAHERMQKAKMKYERIEHQLSELTTQRPLEDSLAENVEEFSEIKRKYKHWETEKASIAQQLQDLGARLQSAIEERDNQPNQEFEQQSRELKELKERLRERDRHLHMERQNLVQKREDLLRANQQQKHLLSHKLHTLANAVHNRSLIDAWEFYEKNRDQFRHPVHVPYLHMRVLRTEYLDYFNNTVGRKDMAMFIFRCKEDEELLMRNGFKVNSSIIYDESIKEHERPYPLPQALRDLGFQEFVSELFEAPATVRAYLCSMFQLHKIPIGSRAVDERSEEIAQRIGREYGLFLTANYRIQVTFSRYSNASYTARSRFNRNGLLHADHTQQTVDFGADLAANGQQIRQNDEARQEFARENEAFRQKVVKYQETEKTVREKAQCVELLQSKQQSFERRLNEYQRQKPNIEVATAAFEEKKRTLAADAVQNFRRLVTLMEEQRVSLRDVALTCAQNDRVKAQIRAARDERDAQEAKVDEAHKHYEEKTRQHQALSEDIREAKRNLMNACEMQVLPDVQLISAEPFTVKEKTVIKKLKEQFSENNVPDAEEEVDEQLRAEHIRLDARAQDGDRNDVVEYEKLTAEAERIRDYLTNEQQMNDRWADEMEERLQAWIQPMEELIARLNANYARFFEQLGCAARVELKRPPDDKFDVNKYGITIYVKFRKDAELRPLTHQTQSGGERSVATMLFLMALQDLCPVPFRCVDEINQGMDPDNERRVFNMMVQLLSSSGGVAKTQYFLLTPKLLGGLEFNQQVTVHVVHNGPTMENIEHWDPEKFLLSAA